MSGKFCWLCNGIECYAGKVERIVDGACSEIDPNDSDIELDGGDLSVSVVDGPRQYVAHFAARYCPMCGKEL